MFRLLGESLRASGQQWVHWAVDLLGAAEEAASDRATVVGSKRRRLPGHAAGEGQATYLAAAYHALREAIPEEGATIHS